MASDVRLRRVYDGSSPTAGKRVLVDRVWPRGLKKESLALDLWLRDLGPSDETGTVQFGPMAIMIAIALVGGMLALAAFSRRDAIA